MTATPARKPHTRPERHARICRLESGAFILWLTSGKDVWAYRVERLESQIAGVAFRLSKADRGDGLAEFYDVLLDGPRSVCSCKGHLRYGMCKDGKGCKHIAGLEALRTAGLIPAALLPAGPALSVATEEI